MKLRPLHNQLVVAVEEPVQQSASGLYIAGGNTDSRKATVLAVGPGRRDAQGNLIPMDVSEGDTVILHKGAGEMVKVDGQEFLIIRDSDIYAVVNA